MKKDQASNRIVLIKSQYTNKDGVKKSEIPKKKPISKVLGTTLSFVVWFR